MIAENRSLMAFNLIWLWDRVDQLARLYGEVAGRISQPPLVGHRFTFAEAPAALSLLQSGESVGKVVLEM
jgi:alcohol dehydrogenase